MFAHLIPPLLPQAVTDLFQPPLDPSKIHLSITTGLLELEHLVLNAEKVNETVLGGLSPVHLKSGRFERVGIEIDWRHILTQPILVQAHGVKLVLTHNTIEQTKEVGGVAVTESKQVSESVSVTGGTESATVAAAGESKVNESQLLEAAIQTKLDALQFVQPNALNLTPLLGMDVSQMSLNGATKRLITTLLRSLHIQASDIIIEYEHDHCQAHETAARETKMTSGEMKEEMRVLAPTADTIATVASNMDTLGISSASHNTAHLGLSIKGCKLESFRSTADQLGLPTHMNMIKQLHADDVAIWCDAPGGSHTRVGETSSGEKRTVDPVLKSTEATPSESVDHAYILPPFTSDIHFACNSQISLNLDLMLKTIMPSVELHIRPEQLQSILAIIVSIQQHLVSAQTYLELVAAQHFRPATGEERVRYVEIYKRILSHRSLRGGQQKVQDEIERACTFADLVGMRSQAFTELQEEVKRKHEVQLRAMTVGATDTFSGQKFEPEEEEEPFNVTETGVRGESVTMTEPVKEKEPTFWQVVWSYIGLIDTSSETGGHETPTATPTEKAESFESKVESPPGGKTTTNQ